jgi:hypothetical protein
MDGTTEGDLGTTPFGRCDEIMLGGCVNTCDVSLVSNEASDSGLAIGIALETTTTPKVIDCWIKPYWL